MLIGLLFLFPLLAVVWMLVCNRLGLVEDQPLYDDDRRARPAAPRGGHSGFDRYIRATGAP